MAEPILPKYDITFTEQFKTELAQAWENGDDIPNLELIVYVGETTSSTTLYINYDNDYPKWDAADKAPCHIYCDTEGENAILEVSSEKVSLQIKVETVNTEYTEDFAAAVLQVINDYA